MPSLKKTKLCFQFMKGHCSLGEKCSYAHGEKELRFTDQYYKTAICRAFTNGNCAKGDTCRFAHGAEELRTPTLELPQKLEIETEPQNENRDDDEEMIREVLNAAKGNRSPTPTKEPSNFKYIRPFM